ncbi:hypothetical protein GTC6_05367 [Gordonia terrae C-6]|uniref:Uncharacterized protein n=1 Tax=Gordonia terrae C-6 TaxID=1316928 RepID=R7YCK9_9ACTN|nr:hypothetical protein [Gordonia terrae]EON33770.1 hypothetical protein GTC6_05367 [Gordonia terrae C-6]
MSERLTPNPEDQPRYSDEELIERSIDRALETEQRIDDATAKVIASMLHSGQFTALYALSSSGAISHRLADELDLEHRLSIQQNAPEIRRWVEQLQAYVQGRESHDPVEGWPQLWLQQPEAVERELDDEDCCVDCGEHFADPHAPGCPREDVPNQEEPAEDDARSALEAKVQSALGHLTTSALIRRIEKAQDFGYDDEAVELSRRLREEGKDWRWSDDFCNPRIVIEGGES